MSEFKNEFDLGKNFAYDISKNIVSEGEVVDEKVINQSLENIILTNFGERVFRSDFGSNLLASIFEAGNSKNAQFMYSNLLKQVQKNEKRVTLDIANCSMFMDSNNNTAYITIKYRINDSNINGKMNKKITL